MLLARLIFLDAAGYDEHLEYFLSRTSVHGLTWHVDVLIVIVHLKVLMVIHHEVIVRP